MSTNLEQQIESLAYVAMSGVREALNTQENTLRLARAIAGAIDSEIEEMHDQLRGMERDAGPQYERAVDAYRLGERD